ncbi:unnamed protein product, partial [Cyprideis torosa]
SFLLEGIYFEVCGAEEVPIGGASCQDVNNVPPIALSIVTTSHPASSGQPNFRYDGLRTPEKMFSSPLRNTSNLPFAYRSLVDSVCEKLLKRGVVAIRLCSQSENVWKMAGLMVENTFTSIPHVARSMRNVRLVQHLSNFCYKNKDTAHLKSIPNVARVILVAPNTFVPSVTFLLLQYLM